MRGRTKRLLTIVVVVVLLAGARIALGIAATSQHHAPQPSAAAAGTVGVRTTTTTSSQPSTSGEPSTEAPIPTTAPQLVLPASSPNSITIPAIGVHSPLSQVGLDSDGHLEVPQPGPDYNKAAWYRGSPTPGQLGPAVIEGHVDSAADGPSVFFKLGAMRPGDMVSITRADGTTAVFRTDGVQRYPKDAFPDQFVYGNTTNAQLRLITCGGTFDRQSGHYTDNIVVFITLVTAQPSK